MGLTVQRADSPDATAPFSAAWEALSHRSLVKLPFTSPRWVLPWWRHHARSHVATMDYFRCYGFFDGGELVGVAPLVVTHRPGRGPLALRQLQVAGADANVTEVNAVLAKEGRDGDVFTALLDALERDGGWDSGLWWVPAGSASEAVLQARPQVSWQGERPCLLLDPGPEWGAFKSSRSRNIKESLRKCYNSLARDGHAFTFHARSGADELPSALDRFFSLHGARAAATQALAHDDWFAGPRERAFLREAVSQLAGSGQAWVFELEIEGQVAATRVGFQVGDSLYLYYSGYRPQWGRYSVMTTCTAEAIKWAIAKKLAVVNLSFGRDTSKLRWSPREVMFKCAIVHGGSLRARYGAGAAQFLQPRIRRALDSPRLKALKSVLKRGS